MYAAPNYLKTIKTESVFCRLIGCIEREDSNRFYSELKKLIKKYDVRCVFQDGSAL